MYSYINLEQHVPENHRLRSIRIMVHEALVQFIEEF